MRRLISLGSHVRTLQYVLIAVVAFSLGGATVVQAVAPSGILGTVRIADRSDETRVAAVDANGNVGVNVNNFAATQQVSGSVSVSNFPATQNVSVTGNTAATPIFVQDVDEAARHAHVMGLCASTDSPCNPITVPAGMRFVIEQVSGQCNVGSDASLEGFTLTAQLSGANNVYWFRDKLDTVNSEGTALGTFLEQTHIYADGNISAGEFNTGGLGDSFCAITLSGHLVSIP
jgi:hypothetical protein